VTSRPRDPAAVGGRVGLGGDGRGVLIEKEGGHPEKILNVLHPPDRNTHL